jgi:hypothetical protein
VQLPTPFTPSPLFVPGQWPREQSSVTPAEENAPTTTTGSSSFLITIGKWAATVAIANLLVLPVRIAQRFLRRQQIRVQPIVREDGARKKRIIDVGLAHEPATPSPIYSARAALARRFPNRRTELATLSSPDSWSPSPSPVQSYERQDAAQPAQSVAKSNLDAHLLPNGFVHAPLTTELRHAQLKPRIFARAGYGSVGKSTQVVNAPLPPRIFSGLGIDAHTVPRILVHPPNAPSYTRSFWGFSKNSNGAQALAAEDADTSVDDSDLSFTDVWSSNTPPRPTFETSSTFTNTSSQNLQVPKTTPVRRRRVDEALKISPNSHDNIIKRAPVTPMRKKLVKGQLGNYQGLRRPAISPTSNHTVPAPAVHIDQQTELKQKVYQTSVLKINATNIAHSAHKASEQYAKAREQEDADLRAADLARFNHVETIDQDLSWLSDAPDEEEEVPAQAPPAPATPLPLTKKTVTWAPNAGAKPFFCDEAICDMMDSTIESIVFTPRKSLADELAEADTSESEDDERDDAFFSQSPDKVSSTQSPQRGESAGFTGVPASTWEDSEDSLDESQISIELLEDLQEDWQKKMALAPTPPLPPPVKAFIAPLSSEEQEKLDAAAAATANGKHSDMWIVDEKLSARDFGTLLPSQFNGDPKAWLNDNIVNEYLGVLIAKMKAEAGFKGERGGPAPPVHAFSSFWYSTLKARPGGVARWAARFHLAGKQYLDANVLLYPICHKGHWRLLAVKPKERTIEYLDSLGWNGDEFIETMKEYLASELKEHYVEEEWTVLKKQRSSQQLNGSDCGVFTVLNSLALLRGEETNRVLACDGMLEARKRIAVTLMNGAPTTELE